MFKIKLTEKRKDLLANFSLNVAAISLGVAAYEQNWLGYIIAIISIYVFLLFTKES